MNITCPKCQTVIELDKAISQEQTDHIRKAIAKELEQQKNQELDAYRKQMEDYKLTQDKKANQYKEQLADEMKREIDLEKNKLNNKNEAELNYLKQLTQQQEKDLQISKQNEFKILQLTQQIKDKEQQAELEKQKAILQAEDTLKKNLSKQLEEDFTERYEKHNREQEHKYQSLQKQLEEAHRKINQGSMEVQGEVHEDFIKEKLQKLFPFDNIIDVKKGTKGADLIQIIRNQFGHECGKILFEGKNTKAWANDWVVKLKQDMLAANADVGIIVTQALPSDVKNIGNKDGIWICTIKELEGVAAMLRHGVLNVYTAKSSQENKGDKMTLLYNYLNSNEFRQKWDSIREGFSKMKETINKQREFLARTFAEQDQIANNILINANTFLGDIQGISGNGNSDNKLLE
jgi:hypothetical protein